MSAEIVEFETKSTIKTGGGGGPGGGVLEQRVSELETAVARIETKVDRMEAKLERHDEAFRRIEDALRSLAEDTGSSSKSLTDLREKVAHIDGRLANIPTTWQTVAILATLLIGLSGIILTASRFLHP